MSAIKQVRYKLKTLIIIMGHCTFPVSIVNVILIIYNLWGLGPV